MNDRRSNLVWITALSLLLFPLLLYIVSYLVLVRPFAVLIPVRGESGSYDMRHYAYGGAYAETIYWPLEQVDRRIRPDRWHEPIFH